MRCHVPVVLLLAGCATRGPSYVPKPTGEAEFRAKRLVRHGGDRSWAAEIDPEDRSKSPPRLVRELDRGKNWLVLEHPAVFSAAAADLLGGNAVFPVARVEIRFAQQEGEGTRQPPALLVLSGEVGSGDLGVAAAHAPAALRREGLGTLDNPDLRVALGNGLDTAMRIGTERAELETYAWVAVLDQAGPVEAAVWHEGLRGVRRQASLDPLRPYDVLVRRWRPGSAAKEAFFRIPLASVVLCSQMDVREDGEALRWIWEGVWSASLQGEPTGTPVETTGPVVVKYSQFREVRAEGGGAVWRALLSPVTLGVKYSTLAAERFFEGE